MWLQALGLPSPNERRACHPSAGPTGAMAILSEADRMEFQTVE